MVGGVASKLGDEPVFDERLQYWYERLGKKFATFMHRVQGKILDNDFNTLMMKWCTSLGTAKFMSFISGGIAAR